MAVMLERLREAIMSTYVPENQSVLEETFGKGKKKEKMQCSILSNPKQEYLLCKLDRQEKNNKLFPYFNDAVDGLVCMCDYILFLEEKSRLIVLLLELKTKESPNAQLDRSYPFATFICEKLRAIHKDFDKHYTIRKVGIKSSYKQKYSTQYKFAFDDNEMALLPNPNQLKLSMISAAIE